MTMTERITSRLGTRQRHLRLSRCASPCSLLPRVRSAASRVRGSVEPGPSDVYRYGGATRGATPTGGPWAHGQEALARRSHEPVPTCRCC